MSDPFDRNGLQDYDGLEDEAFPALPPPHSPGQGGHDEGNPFSNEDEDGDVSKSADVPAAKRKGVKRPQPKSDSNRSISDRGLPASRTSFDDVRYKGKGHEAEDLRSSMGKMENWAHRSFPKLQFEDFMDRVEKLGTKKEVQTCLKRIRLDMPSTHEDYVENDGEEVAPEPNVFRDPDPFNGSIFPGDLQRPVHSTPAPVAPPSPSPVFPSPAAPSSTEEQRQRMESNRRRASERKLARQQQQQTDSQTSADEPTSVSSANVSDESKDQDSKVEEEVEDLDSEPASSSTQQEPSQLPHKDSEPPAGSPQGEEEPSSHSQVHQPSNECEDEV